MTAHDPTNELTPDPELQARLDVLNARLRAYRDFITDLDRTDFPTPLDLATAYAVGRTRLHEQLRELAVVPAPAQVPNTATHAAPGTPEDAPPTVDPRVAALYRPPYQPQQLQLHVNVRVDPDTIWVEVPELPGLFATGATIPELGATLGEAVDQYLQEHTTIVGTDDDEPPAEENPTS